MQYCLSPQDLENPDLLFLGTEFGLYVSLDGGKGWARFEGNLPKVGVRDLAIHPREGDLIIGTHGRGIYIMRQTMDEIDFEMSDEVGTTVIMRKRREVAPG